MLVAPGMRSIGSFTRRCTIQVAVAGCLAASLAGCGLATDDDLVEDLGTLADDKSDTSLPRTVELQLEPGARKRYRITTAAFVATLSQDGDVDASLTAQHRERIFESAVADTPRLEVSGDGATRIWTLTVRNLGDEPLDATVVIDVPRALHELGIVSDIDKTVLPPEGDTGLPPPYPGVVALLHALERTTAGDVHFVTARQPEGIVDIPAWMDLHGVPKGPIETGVSGVPWIAQAEKVRDISRILDARAGQRFVLFGDTSHRDPEVYAEIRAAHPDRIAAIFIHKVNATVSASRVEGMHLVANYAEAAARAFGDRLLTEDEAREVMTAARADGLDLTDAEIDALIDTHR